MDGREGGRMLFACCELCLWGTERKWKGIELTLGVGKHVVFTVIDFFTVVFPFISFERR